jgi:hypothetical protein
MAEEEGMSPTTMRGRSLQRPRARRSRKLQRRCRPELVDWTLVDRVGTLLRSLGRSPSDVASNLHALGARGMPREANHCVLARYLGAVISCETHIEEVLVLRDIVVIGKGNSLDTTVVDLPASIGEFIRRFDAGAYPWLFRTPEEFHSIAASPGIA